MTKLPPSGLYRLSSIACAICSRTDDRNFLVNLDGITGKEEVLKTIGKACRFPEWYGANLDALHDCLTDWTEGNYVVCIDHSAAWREADPKTYRTFCKIIKDVCKTRKNSSNYLHIFIDDQALPTLPDTYKPAFPIKPIPSKKPG